MTALMVNRCPRTGEGECGGVDIDMARQMT
jgi:hypothetical protein